MKCPICDRINRDMRCPDCGFDYSRNYEKYPTFSTPVRTAAPSSLRKRSQYRRSTADLVEPVQRVQPARPARPAEPVQPPRPEPAKEQPVRPTPPKEQPRPQTAQTTVREPVRTPVNTVVSVRKNKWLALLLCFFLGMFGAHKFYEGKKGMGVLYLCTMGLFGYGWLFDCIALLCKPNPYFVKINR